MKRLSALIVPLIMLAILAAGSVMIVLATGSDSKPRTIHVAAVLKTIDKNMEFWEVVKAGMREAAKESYVSLEIYGPWAESDIEGQIKIMGNVIAERPDAIILSATDFNALLPSVREAEGLRIPVVTLDSNVNSSYPRTFVATNNVEAGMKAGREMMKLLSPGSTVAIINHIKGATTAMEREKGTLETLEADGRYPLLGVFYTNNFEENAYRHTLRLAKEHPELKGIIALNEVSALGAARGLVDLKAGDRISLVGFDSSILEISLMERGYIDATVIQQPFKMGYLAVRAARDVMDGRNVDKFIDTGSILLTPETIYLPENQKIVFPFMDISTLNSQSEGAPQEEKLPTE